DEPLIPIYGTPPDLIKPPAGCGFCARCNDVMEICVSSDPEKTNVSDSHQANCWLLHPLAQEVAR
ncbi:oligopeptide/dipeptide ABC transporter ATP-binding protein, partial [Paenibacillus sp.]|uniref:oligopeptide/dipeptide ABC transporter ATP-binding protein n=1 Tax=Paenibacillus sp. TaxID=58172 RepID=UPI00346432C2